MTQTLSWPYPQCRETSLGIWGLGQGADGWKQADREGTLLK